MIDCHTHVFPAKVAPKMTAAIARDLKRNPVGDGSVENLLAHLDQAGLKQAVCFTAALRPDQMIPANSWMRSLRKSQTRLIPLGTVHPDHPSWESELARLEESGIRGLKLHPDLSGIPLDSPRWNRVWEAAQDRFVIMLHMGPIAQGGKTLSRPRDLAAILRNFPRLEVIAAHLGGLFLWKETLQHLAGRNVFMDTACCPGVIDDQVFADILRRHDSERILFGSDYPLFAPKDECSALSILLGRINVPPERIIQNGSRLAKRLQTGGYPDVTPSPRH